MLTINLLQALPRTPLYERLQREGRIIEDDTRESNVVFRLPYEDVIASWKRCIAAAYEPSALYARYAYNVAHTYPNRIHPAFGKDRASWSNVAYGMKLLASIFVRVGGLSSYRRIFWDTAMPLLRAGRIEEVIHIGLVGHHLIKFTREALSGQQNAAFYAPAERQAQIA